MTVIVFIGGGVGPWGNNLKEREDSRISVLILGWANGSIAVEVGKMRRDRVELKVFVGLC